MDDCLACDLAAGRQPLPGGLIHRTDHWLVEHCVGPLGLGALVVKPKRHVTAVAEVPGRRRLSSVGSSAKPRTWQGSWSLPSRSTTACGPMPAGGRFTSITVVQPVTRDQMTAFGAHGPVLQVAMFQEGEIPPPAEVEGIAERARGLFAGMSLRHG